MTVLWPFGARIWAVNTSGRTDEDVQWCGTLSQLDDVLRASDVLVIALPLTKETRGLLGARELSLMKPTAHLINTSRGPIVDEAALIAALRSGKVTGAGLDVYDEEPLPLDHPLRNLPNTVITPHLGYVTAETYRIFYGHALEDVQAWLGGAPVRVLKP